MDVLVSDPNRMTAAEAFERVFAFNIERYISHKGFVGSGNLFCRRLVFDQVGEFGTGVSEDVDWSHRAAAKKFSIGFAPRVGVGHPARRSWAELKNKWSRIDSETFSLKARRKVGRLIWIFRCLMLPVSALVHTPRVLLSGDLKGAQKIAALGMLYRIRFWRAGDYCRLLVRGPRN